MIYEQPKAHERNAHIHRIKLLGVQYPTDTPHNINIRISRRTQPADCQCHSLSTSLAAGLVHTMQAEGEENVSRSRCVML